MAIKTEKDLSDVKHILDLYKKARMFKSQLLTVKNEPFYGELKISVYGGEYYPRDPEKITALLLPTVEGQIKEYEDLLTNTYGMEIEPVKEWTPLR